MEGLIKAAADFLAAILGTVGFVGRPRRRSGIHADLQLLRDLETFPQFGPESFPHSVLSNRVVLDVAKLAGVDLETTPRKIPWSSIIMATIIGAPLGYLTYWLIESGQWWFAILPAIPAGLMLIAILGMLLPEQEAPTQPDIPGQLELPTVETESGGSD